jgi:hypothetical protein
MTTGMVPLLLQANGIGTACTGFAAHWEWSVFAVSNGMVASSDKQ